MQPTGLTKQELRIVSVLAGIFSLRMLGLFMLLPVFALEAAQYTAATPQLIGWAVGLYGLAQAVLQIPFGYLSDRYGRKALILFGLACIVLGSLLAAWTTNIYGLIAGRVLQGCGAFGSVVIATMADNTREQKRALSMAILGASIGLSFALALVLGPWINQYFGLPGIFGLTAGLAVVAMILLASAIPSTKHANVSRRVWPQNWRELFLNTQLCSLYLGVFALHASLAALFLVMPFLIQQAGFRVDQLWQLYLAIIVVALGISLGLISLAKQIEKLQWLAILSMLIALVALYPLAHNWWIVLGLSVFFIAFCVLEASLPSLVSKVAPSSQRGTALGIFSSLQFMGIFIGGAVGGWIQQRFNVAAVLSFCAVLVGMWLIYAGINLYEQRGKSWLEV